MEGEKEGEGTRCIYETGGEGGHGRGRGEWKGEGGMARTSCSANSRLRCQKHFNNPLHGLFPLLVVQRERERRVKNWPGWRVNYRRQVGNAELKGRRGKLAVAENVAGDEDLFTFCTLCIHQRPTATAIPSPRGSHTALCLMRQD